MKGDIDDPEWVALLLSVQAIHNTSTSLLPWSDDNMSDDEARHLVDHLIDELEAKRAQQS